MVTVLVGINSYLSFFIIVIPLFLETTCMGLTHELSKMAYIIPDSRSFTTSFQTCSFIIELSLLRSCATSLKSSSRLMLCMQMDELIPLRSEICHPKAWLFFFSTSTSLFSSSLHIVPLRMVVSHTCPLFLDPVFYFLALPLRNLGARCILPALHYAPA